MARDIAVSDGSAASEKPSTVSATEARDVAKTFQSVTLPEFGKESPLKNKLKTSSVFLPKDRPQSKQLLQTTRAPPERPSAATKKFQLPPTTGQLYGSREAPVDLDSPNPRAGFRLPGQKRQQIQQSHAVASIHADFFDISKPSNPIFPAIQPAPRPTFSSLAPTTRPIIDLTTTRDAFDHNAALRHDAFGTAHSSAYVDPSKASENIKALLEGAFDSDDDNKQKARLPKRRQANKKKSEPIADATTLAEKLSQLAVKENANESKQESHDLGKEGPEDNDDDDDEEDGAVEGLAVTLLPHQVDGVAWMIDKESGQRKKNGVLPKGGILADDMGLGKTIQSIALILTNPRPSHDQQPENPKQSFPSQAVGRGTLVVAPLALIKQWEAEIKTRVERSHALRVLVHHGPNRAKSFQELKKYDVVVTTYQILASEHASSSTAPGGLKVGCFGVSWYRVILDEAHSIKNRNAKSTQACCTLESWYRWCLTGTPMQNNLDELQSLINFLRIKPYNNLRQWREHITGPMKNGKGNQAMKRVQYFLRAFMKRRTKDILKKEGALNFGTSSKQGNVQPQKMNIVARHIETVVCELDDSERAFYDKLSERANNRLQDMMSAEKQDYIAALVLLLRLRQACNHPALIQSAMAKDKDALATAGLGGSQSPQKNSQGPVDGDLDGLTAMLGGLDVALKICDVCQVALQKHEMAKGAIRCSECEQDCANQRTSKTSKKHRRVVRTNVTSSKARSRRVIPDDSDEEGEGHWLVPEDQQLGLDRSAPSGPADEDAEGSGISLGSDDSDKTSDSGSQRRSKGRTSSATELETDNGSDASTNDDEPASSRTSTKIRRIIKILMSEAPTHKVIVFSQFTSMLDLIEPHLARHSLRYVRYDGSMRNDAREASLSSLRDDSKTRVLLCSLKCGALGLNLTAASRVIIVEPFWNPFVEEQAIDRVHRLNQTVDVRVYKLTVANTVEEKILELQAKKRELATAAIEGGKAVAKLSMRDLLNLFGGQADGPVDARQSWRDGQGAATGGGVQPPRAQERGTLAAPFVVPDRKRVVSGGRQQRTGVEDPVYGRR